MGCEHGLISLFSQFFLGCFMDFDRYQVCTEGVLLCPTGWVRYRACSESEILSQYAGQIHMIRRMLHCSDQDFNVFALPLIKVMIRYCMVYQHLSLTMTVRLLVLSDITCKWP